MPHADSAFIPSSIITKEDFWSHILEQLRSLLDGQRQWVTNLANTSSLVYHSLLAFEKFGSDASMVNWCGFYLDSRLFPPVSTVPSALPTGETKLLLGPFSGKPACQFIKAEKGGGVCADAFVSSSSLCVPDVDAYPGHIACDSDTKSEIVIPMVLKRINKSNSELETVVLGVMDLDCVGLHAFDEEDVIGLEKIVQLLVDDCDW